VRLKSRGVEMTPDNLEGMVGTLRYMSPEQIRGDMGLDHRSDLWSVAVVAFRALTGKFPFALDSIGNLLNGSFHPPEAPPSKLLPELGPELDRFFSRALDPDPAQRFQSAQEMAAAFSAVVQAVRPQAAKILVVDDEPDVEVLLRQAFRRQLREGVYELSFACDGEDAMEKLRQTPDVDVILTDINMPRMDGLTFLSRVGEVSPLAKVIIVSAYSDMANLRTAMNRGAYDFLTKPLDLQDLEVTLGKTLKHVAEVRQMMRSIEENSLLRMFVQSSVLERLRPLTQGPDSLAGERVEATVVLIRLLDFAPVTRQKSPAAVIQQLNENFHVIIPELTSRGGVVERFQGDSALVMFRGGEHLGLAVEGCVAVREQIRAMFSRGGEASAYVHGVGIGLDSGEVILGGLGGPELGRLDYTMVGDVVDTATRLAARAGRSEILVTERLCQSLVMDFECRPAGSLGVPGSSTPIPVHDVLGRRGVNFSAGGAFGAHGDSEEEATPQHAALASGIAR
jgi:CheY-like chemotaxis protein